MLQNIAQPAHCEKTESPGVKGRQSVFYFLTPVWGESYTRLYVDTVIPAQLARGNLAAFRREPGHRYIIYTRPQDADFIRASASYVALNECVPVTFEFISGRVDLVHDMMTECYRRGIAEAENANAAIIFLTPDIVFSAGSFEEIRRISDGSWDVIYIPAIRTMKKAVSATLASSFQKGNVIEIPARQLMRIALDSLHPLVDASWWDEGEGGLLPATVYWRVGDEGIVARCFHLHPICVYPQRKGVKFFGTVDDDYVTAACPDSSRDMVVSDSDQLAAIELSDPGRHAVSRLAKGSVADAARWAEQYTDERHRKLFKVGIRMHTGIGAPEKWLATEKRAIAVASDIESHLERPAWRLLFDADILMSRFNQWLKQYRSGLANRRDVLADHQIAAWKLGIVSAGRAFAHARHFVVAVMRRSANGIETRAAKSYQADLEREVVALLPEASDPVLITNTPEKEYIAPLLSRMTASFSSERYASLLRRDSVVFLDKGERILSSSKGLVILEIDAHRTKDFELYLREGERVLCEQGRLVVYLHRLGLVWPTDDRAEKSLAEIVDKIGNEFQVVSIRQQAGPGAYIRVRLAAWFRALISRRLAVRWLLLIFGLPFLPLIMVIGGLFVMAADALDSVARSSKYWISSLILARNDAPKT